MAIPKYDEMYSEFLQVLLDGKAHSIREIRDYLANLLEISDEERQQLLPSGKQTIFNNRVQWTASYLKQAGLIESVSRGFYCITETGKSAFSHQKGQIDNSFLLHFDSFKNFLSRRSDTNFDDINPLEPHHSATDLPTVSSESPQDILDKAYDQINSALIDDLLTEVMKQSPTFFESLIVRLLTQMGYGGSLNDAGIVTQASGDEGIDGIIREDKLGFSRIYIQAKRWDRNSTVGRPEIQKFVGALAGQGASKGLFVTTAQFSREAKEYAEKQHTTKIILIDGTSLAKLMIEYNVGVSVEAVYSIKRIDSDFFDDNIN